MEIIRLTGRNSRLSLLQINLVRKKIETQFPGIRVEIVPRTSRGDALADIPLQTVEGTDFFTRDIFDTLKKGEADIAVHSLKDMSSDHFFGTHHFAVVDRDDTRDLAIFNPGVIEKLKAGKSLLIGTCSPRREEMATQFLQKALPQFGGQFSIQTAPIRGNVETRLRKLDEGLYDGTILATAGLNRLLSSDDEGPELLQLRALLAGKLLMLLPLVECVPAPCQGAIVAEALPSHQRAIAILNAINDKAVFDDCVQEKRIAGRYGKGCLQKFGVTTLYYGESKTILAAGRNEREEEFQHWHNLPVLEVGNRELFSSSDAMKGFFSYDFLEPERPVSASYFFVANYKSFHNHSPVTEELVEELQKKKVWAAGTKTWWELASRNIWVEGSADAFGLESLVPVWSMPVFRYARENFVVITHETAAQNWEKKGWKTLITHRLINKNRLDIRSRVREAGVLFWTSAAQYEQFRSEVRVDAIHACPYGETAHLLRSYGIDPVVFPTIKSFLKWRKYFIPSPDVV